MPINVNKNGSFSDITNLNRKGQYGNHSTTPLSKSSHRTVPSSANIFLQDITVRSYPQQNESRTSPSWYKQHSDSTSMFSDDSRSSPPTSRQSLGSRLKGGGKTQDEAAKLILSPSQCKIKPLGMESYHRPKPMVHDWNFEFHGRESDTNKTFRCPEIKEKPLWNPKTKTRGTQSIYRESSVQTLPYLPPVSNEADELEDMEIFKLPSILPGDIPPGLYEVEVLERARKRWAFAKALKENFRKQLQEAREQAKLPEHAHVLEAFEWEHWIEREEYIQECQMMRLEILIGMFNKREHTMHKNSQTRIEQSCEQIEKRRKASLTKNEIEHSRALRRLEMQHAKRPRVWRKERIAFGLGDPSSEFYAPKMRYGVDPGRRHYTAPRKGFDMRMDDLEKKTVKMDPAHLKCPFAKLNEWSKPKEGVQEVEMNFCSEVNLRKLYESLRTLRETTERPKTTPLCLIAKKPPTKRTEEVHKKEPIEVVEIRDTGKSEEERENIKLEEEREHLEYLHQVKIEKKAEREKHKHLQQEFYDEELETLVQAYEGNTIGWLLRFLTEEMTRLKEQKKLHFFTLLAKQERWHREAAEAGLRQKENLVREAYEKIYQECEQANNEMAEKYVKSIMENDIDDYADQVAEEYIKEVGRKMDDEISGWLESFDAVQNPDNYLSLRYHLKDIMLPDKEKIIHRMERTKIVKYIVQDVLMYRVFKLLEPYDICFALVNDFVDRLIDNDLYLNSPDCSSDCECFDYCSCTRSLWEARAIVRKVIRYAVPGRRWKTPDERVAFENVKDIFNDVFNAAQPRGSIIETDKPMPKVERKFSFIDLREPDQEIFYSDHSEGQSEHSQDYCKILQMGAGFPSVENFTKPLNRTELLLLDDPDKPTGKQEIIKVSQFTKPVPQPNPPLVHMIPSTHDLSSVWDFAKTPVYFMTSSDELEEESKHIAEEMRCEESSSTHKEEIEEEEQEPEVVVEAEVSEEQVVEEVKVHFHAEPEEVVESETVLETDLSTDGDVIPMSFSYDPTVKYSVPIRSTVTVTEEGEGEGPGKAPSTGSTDEIVNASENI